MRRTLKNRTCAVILAGTLIAGCQAGTAWAGMAETLPMTGTERAAVVEPAPVMETDGTGETTKESGSETLENIALTRLENDGIDKIKSKIRSILPAVLLALKWRLWYDYDMHYD